jgi:CDP-glycerol glycerophosphotransferase
LDSLLGQSGVHLQVVVVDDGSTDGSGAIADAYAARDDRVHVLHVTNGGLGSARNVGAEHVTGDFLGFLDSDDVLPPGSLATLASTLEDSGSDFVTGSIVRWEADGLHEPPWMHRLHRERRLALTAREHPEILGDVFAWNKLFRTSFWRAQGLEWPEGVRYEDQPTTTRAFLTGTFDVVPDVVRGAGGSWWWAARPTVGSRRRGAERRPRWPLALSVRSSSFPRRGAPDRHRGASSSR